MQNQITIAESKVKNQVMQYWNSLKTSSNLNLSIQQIINSDLPSISQIRIALNDSGANGNEKVKALIIILICDFKDFINAGKNMNANQINQTADLILEEYYYLKIEEIKLIFNNAKKGLYGAIYDRVDGQMILIWFKTYRDERAALYVEKMTSESNGHKQNLKKAFISDENEEIDPGNFQKMSDFLNGMIHQLKAEIIDENLNKENVKKTYDPLKAEINRYYLIFDRLVKQKEKKHFIAIGGKMLTKQGFAEYLFNKKN